MAVGAPAAAAQAPQPRQPRHALRSEPPERVQDAREGRAHQRLHPRGNPRGPASGGGVLRDARGGRGVQDRKSTRLNSSHLVISYAVFCLKKKKRKKTKNNISKKHKQR